MQFISHILTVSIVASVAFSITHARDVSSALNTVRVARSSSKVTQVDLGIQNHDPHTHIHRQTLTSLLKNMQKDRPQASERHLKKARQSMSKYRNKSQNDKLGHYIPIPLEGSVS